MSKQEENYQPGREKTDEEKLKEREALVSDIENIGQAMQRLRKCTLNKNGGSYHYLIQALFFRMHELGFLEGLRQVSQNMITWHDPEKEKPKEPVILWLQTPDAVSYWREGFWDGAEFWTMDGELLEEEAVVKWGSFELPEIEFRGGIKWRD